MQPLALDHRRGIALGLLSGLAYGLTLRAAWASSDAGGLLLVMSLAFLIVVPFVIGFLTVRPHPKPSWAYRVLAPWVPVSLITAVALAVGWEGSVCIIIGFPLLMLSASVGGIIGGRANRAPTTTSMVVAALPFLVGYAERHWPEPTQTHQVATAIAIAAPPEAVWRQIVTVPTISPAEQRPALFLTLGFPRPLEAVLDGAGVGAVREARFDKGLLFVETVTHWEPGRRLRFAIQADTAHLPPTTLDPHVAVGGRYFDVLEGDYQIDPRPDGTSVLHLTSRLRVSTHLNLYATPWADAIMRSIQFNILWVEKGRAERSVRAGAA